MIQGNTRIAEDRVVSSESNATLSQDVDTQVSIPSIADDSVAIAEMEQLCSEWDQHQRLLVETQEHACEQTSSDGLTKQDVNAKRKTYHQRAAVEHRWFSTNDLAADTNAKQAILARDAQQRRRLFQPKNDAEDALLAPFFVGWKS
jgi:hypothetical protein